MKNLIKYEFRKLFRAKSFYICFGIAMALVLLSSLAFLGMKVMGANPDITGLDLMLSAVSSTDSHIIMTILVAIQVCGEYTDGITKMIIGRGYSRSQVYFAKFAATASVAMLLSVLAWLFGFVSGTAVCGVGHDWSPKIVVIFLAQFLYILAVSAFALFLSTALRKSGGVIAIGIFTPTVVSLVLSLTEILSLNLFDAAPPLTKYWVTEISSRIASVDVDMSDLWKAAGMLVLYVLVPVIGGYLLDQKRDV